MLLRALLLAALGLAVFRLLAGRWPWERRIPAAQEALARARHVLGVEAHANRIEIIAAHRRLVARVHPDRGGSKRQMHEANDARDRLLAALPGAAAGSGQEPT